MTFKIRPFEILFTSFSWHLPVAVSHLNRQYPARKPLEMEAAKVITIPEMLKTIER